MSQQLVQGGQSNHNFGIAWDVGLFNHDGSYNENDNDYIALSHDVFPALTTLEWGGNWHSLKDYPHYQLKAVSSDIAAIRVLFEQGNVFVWSPVIKIKSNSLINNLFRI